MTSKGTVRNRCKYPIQVLHTRARTHTHTLYYHERRRVWVRAHGEENARVGRGIGSQWSTFLGKAVRVLAARAVTALTTRLSFQYDPRESGKRSNELQNCNAITAITSSSQLHDRSARSRGNLFSNCNIQKCLPNFRSGPSIISSSRFRVASVTFFAKRVIKGFVTCSLNRGKYFFFLSRSWMII